MPTYQATIPGSQSDASQGVVGGATNTNNTSLQSINGSNILVGLRWTGATIPKNALINDVRLELYFIDTKYDDVDLVCYGQLSTNAVTFGTGTDNLYNKVKTTASVVWTGTALAAGGAGYYSSPNLASTIQEIVNQAAWSNSSRAVSLILDSSSVNNLFSVHSFDTTSANPARITIIYDTVLPTGIASTVAFGTPTLSPGAVSLSPSGIASTVAFGTPTVSSGASTVSPTGIASTAAFGSPTLTPGAVAVSPTGIASTAALGSPTLSPGAVTLTVSGIDSTVAFGTPTLSIAGLVLPTGIASTVSFGTPTLTPGAVTLTVSGIASTLSFGTVVLTRISPALPDLDPIYVVIRERMITNNYEHPAKTVREKGLRIADVKLRPRL